MTTELHSFAEAAALAVAEMEQASSVDADTSMPEVEAEAAVEDGQAEGETSEQADSQADPETDNDPEESLFGDLEVEEAPAASAIDDSSVFDLPGVEGQVTLKELKDGYLRQADYTRKTQEVAETRKQNERAVGLWEALRANPEAVVRQLAAQVGLVEEGQAPVKAVEFSPITTAEQMEAEIAKRVESAVAEHPAVVDAQLQQAVSTIHAEFDRLEGVHGVSISTADREVVLKEAQRRGVGDLELVFTSLLAQRERKAQERAALKGAAPARPTGTPTSETKSGHADSFQEAAQMALLELGLQAD